MPVRSRAGWGGNLIGRLKQGVGVQAAQTSLSRLVGQLEAEATWTKAAGVEVAGLHAWNVQTARSTVLMLFSATGFILLLACVNVSGLQVARGAERVRELGIRASLGASRSRLVRQLLTESVLLSICAGVAGAGLAWLTLNLLVSTLPLSIPAGMQPVIDAQVLAFAMAVSGASGCLFGLLPAFRLTRGRSGRKGRRIRIGDHIAPVRRRHCAGADRARCDAARGREPDGEKPAAPAGGRPRLSTRSVLAIAVHPALTGEDRDVRRSNFYREAIDRVAAMPSVTAVGAIDTLPFDSVSYSSVEVEGMPQPVDVSPRVVTPGYLGAMNITVKAGRALTWGDRADAPCVVVVNQQAGKALWGDASPLGRRLRRNAKSPWCEVVGLVQDTRHFSREAPVLLEVYFAAQQSASTELTVVARGTNVEPLPPLIRARLSGLPEATLLQRITPMTELVNRSAEQRQQRAQLLSALGGVGVLLACVGIFGLTAYAVARRTQEIGVRIALGANSRRVLQSVMSGFVPAIFGGVVLGLLASWAGGRALESYLFGVAPADPPTLASVAGLFIAIALLACYLPARRALKVDPVVALRSE